MIKVVGNALVVTSSLTKKLLDTAKTFGISTRVTDKDDNEVFAISQGTTASLNTFGAVFNGVDKDGFATATIMLPSDTKGSKIDYVKNTYGVALANLSKAEELIAKEFETEKARVEKMFEGVEEE